LVLEWRHIINHHHHTRDHNFVTPHDYLADHVHEFHHHHGDDDSTLIHNHDGPTNHHHNVAAWDDFLHDYDHTAAVVYGAADHDHPTGD
jgi:hypothetical protein